MNGSVLAKYAKAFGVVAVTVLTFLVSVITDGLTSSEVVLVVGVGVSGIGVAVVPNLDAGIAQVAKTIVAFLLAGLTVLATVIPGGLTGGELAEVIVAALAAIGVTAIPNAWPPATQRALPPGQV